MGDALVDADPSFVQYHFEAIPRLNNYLRPLVNKGAKNTLLISDEDAVSGEVCFPAVLEQQEIGLFFQSLDALIAGRETALEKLEALKKSMLLKMFPQGDATTPEVRFKGFAGDWEKKYSDLKSEYDTYKTDVEAKATKVAKESAYRKLLIKAGISEKRIDSIVKVSDINGITLDKDGNIKDADKLEEGVKTEWADFIQTTQIKGADVSNPPSNTGGEEKKPSRASQMVAQYRNEHYGNPIKED